MSWFDWKIMFEAKFFVVVFFTVMLKWRIFPNKHTSLINL